MRDRDIAASLAAGDPEGMAAAYDGHAAGLYGYCRSVLAEPSDAADAVQDTFIIAAARLGALRNQGRLRAWLYAVARNEAQARLRAGARPAGPDPAGDRPAVPVAADGSADPWQAELRSLVLGAIGALHPADREVAELSRRHGLGDADLAGVLGVPLAQARSRAARTAEQLARALGTRLVAGTGGGKCAGLDALLDGWDGRPTVVWRTRAGRHIDGCEACGRRRRQVLGPAMLLRLLPLEPLPDSLREHVLWLVPDDSPEAVSYRDEVVGRAGPFDPAGFPVQITPAAWAGRSGRSGRAGGASGSRWGRDGDRPAARRLAVAAVVLILAGGGGIAAVVLHGRGDGRAAADAAGAAVPLSAPGAPAAGGSAQPGGPAPDPGRPVSSSPASSSRPARAGSSAAAVPPPSSPVPPGTQPPASSPPAVRPPSSPPVLSESPGTVSMTEGGTNLWSGSLTLTAANGPVSFSISAPPGVSVSQSGGTVRPGAPVTISVSYVSGLLPAFPGSLSVDGSTVGLTYVR
jgi:RNA polymerase sigma factor (sigma-70 family)